MDARPLTLASLLLISALLLAEGPEEIVVGWTGPLSGDCAVVGVDSVEAVRLAFDEANTKGGMGGRSIRLVVEEDGYDTTRAVSAYNKLVHHHGAKIVIANTYGGVFATARAALRDNVLVIDPLDCNDDLAALPENTLCLATRSESISEAFAERILSENNGAALVLVEESDGWMQLIARNLRERLDRAGVAVMEASFHPEAGTYRTTLMKAKRAGAAAVVLLGNDQMGVAPKEMLELGFSAQIYGVGSILSPGFRALAGKSIEEALVSSWLAPRTPAFETFLSKFKERTGRVPALELASVPSYDAANLIVSCLRTLSSTSETLDGSRIRRCLTEQQNYSGLTGNISFDRDGAVRNIRERLYRVRGGVLTPP